MVLIVVVFVFISGWGGTGGEGVMNNFSIYF